ncbi:MAG: NAD-binding protein, partial [Actinomycetes bacterium]
MTPDAQESRRFGAGAAGDLTSTSKAKPPTRSERLHYLFDNSLFKRPGSFLWWLILASALATGITSFLWVSIQPVEGRSEFQGFFDQFFSAFNTIFFGNGPSMATWTDRAFSLACWVISTGLMATIIAVISNLISVRMDELKKGKSRVLETNHTLILGWSSRIFPILQQLSIANSNANNPVVVIFADMDREHMDAEIASRVGDMGKTRVITRTGDTSNPRDLERAAVSSARSIIILDDDDSGDAAIVSSVLAIRACAPDSRVSIVAEIDELDHADALSHATDGQLKAVQSQDVIARVTAQASRQPGLAAVVLDLLDFEGDEIYFTDAA